MPKLALLLTQPAVQWVVGSFFGGRGGRDIVPVA